MSSNKHTDAIRLLFCSCGNIAVSHTKEYDLAMKRTSWIALGIILAVMAIVVYSTFQIGGVRCEVCITFHGRQVCREVDGATEHEAQMAAITNACALLASGVTDTIACQNAPRDRLTCSPE